MPDIPIFKCEAARVSYLNNGRGTPKACPAISEQMWGRSSKHQEDIPRGILGTFKLDHQGVDVQSARVISYLVLSYYNRMVSLSSYKKIDESFYYVGCLWLATSGKRWNLEKRDLVQHGHLNASIWLPGGALVRCFGL